MRVLASMLRSFIMSALAATLIVGAAAAGDRSPSSSFHAQAGPSFYIATPAGSVPWDIGYSAGAGVDAGIAYGVSATFDLGYTHFGPGDAALLGRVGDNLTVGSDSTRMEAKVLTVMIGAKYEYRSRAPKLITPYVRIAGGLGHASYGDAGTSSAARSISRAVVAGAAGMEIRPRWLPLGLLVEGQYVRFFDEGVRAQYVPVRAGFTLGL